MIAILFGLAMDYSAVDQGTFTVKATRNEKSRAKTWQD
jgi:hypothetical protein